MLGRLRSSPSTTRSADAAALDAARVKFTIRRSFAIPASAVTVIRSEAELQAFIERLRRDDPEHPFLEPYAELDDR
jgi:hypothetical protein